MIIQKIKGLVTTGRWLENDFELQLTTKEDRYPTKNTCYTSKIFEGDIVIHYNNGLISSIEVKAITPKEGQ